MPATAATRIHSPTRMPTPMATSPTAMTTPTAVATGIRWATSPWIGLDRSAPASWAWIPNGLAVVEELGIGELLAARRRGR